MMQCIYQSQSDYQTKCRSTNVLQKTLEVEDLVSADNGCCWNWGSGRSSVKEKVKGFSFT